MAAETLARPSARDRLLAAANELFYEEGIRSVGIDRVIERAGVAKASLYNTFGSKDELILAYLAHRQATRQQRIQDRLSRDDSPREQLLAVFDVLDDVFTEPGYRGCAFVNARAEANAGDSVELACDSIRAWIRGLFARLAGEVGAAEPDLLAQQLVLLYDGAMVSARMDHNLGAAKAARVVAAALVDAATTNAAVPS